MSAEAVRCSCGCALAAWSMPWPAETAPWSPAVVHDGAPAARTTALFPYVIADGDTAVAVAADPDLVDSDYLAPVLDTRALDPAVLNSSAPDSAVPGTARWGEERGVS